MASTFVVFVRRPAQTSLRASPGSPVLANANLPAIVQDRAARAVGERSRTNVLPERDEQTVDLDPVRPWELLHQRCHCPLGGRGSNVAPPVRDAVHVDVDADVGLPAGDPECEPRTLWPHAREGKQQRHIARQLASVVLLYAGGYGVDLARFRLVERAAPNEGVYSRGRQGGDGRRRAR